MENQPILDVLAAHDPEIAERLVTRRSAIVRGAAVSSVVAAGLRLASAPVAIAALARDAYGQTRLPAPVINVLNFALTLEYLEAEFYNTGVASGVIPAMDLAIFTTIRDHENAHVAFLQQTLGPSARPKPTFDFTAGNGSGAGPYAGVFTNYEIFKAVAQAFEDTGVRAYKGQAPALMPYKDVLTAALTIHSVEARHAAEVRRLRGNFQDTEPYYEGWITQNLTDVPGAGAVYAGEENTVQGGVDVVAVAAADGVSATSVTEAFDEPLTQAQVLAIVDPFIV
jgi:hypothetical protein